MRILLVHNAYGSAAPSGENEVVRIEREMLMSTGHEVEVFSRDSDEIRAQGWRGLVKGAAAVPWNPFEAARFRRAAQRFQPDIVHAHNTFPLISPAVFSAAPAGAGRVLTLHNYRLLCAAAIPLREGKTCTTCIDKRSAWPGLRHGCYRDSRAATLPISLGIALHRRRGTWDRDVDAFIALTQFQRDLLTAGGLPAAHIHVKPNFFPGEPDVVPWSRRENHCVFVGRLSPEKGVATLVRAWRAWGPQAPELRVLGDGPLRVSLEAAARGANIRFLGHLPAASAQDEIARARLMIVPSEWFEGFPLVLREAFALGTPVAVSRIGPLPTLVDEGRCGLVFDAFDDVSLLDTVRSAWDAHERLAALAAAGRAEFALRYTTAANAALLMAIYDKALSVRRRRHDAH